MLWKCIVSFMLEKNSVLWKTHRGCIYSTPLFNAVTSLTIVCENKQKAWSPLHTLPINHWNIELRLRPRRSQRTTDTRLPSIVKEENIGWNLVWRLLFICEDRKCAWVGTSSVFWPLFSSSTEATEISVNFVRGKHSQNSQKNRLL